MASLQQTKVICTHMKNILCCTAHLMQIAQETEWQNNNYLIEALLRKTLGDNADPIRVATK